MSWFIAPLHVEGRGESLSIMVPSMYLDELSMLLRWMGSGRQPSQNSCKNIPTRLDLAVGRLWAVCCLFLSNFIVFYRRCWLLLSMAFVCF